MQPTFPHIVREARVVHKLYGSGKVIIAHRAQEQAGVVFDGERVPRRVWMRHLVIEPAPLKALPPRPAGRPELAVVR